MENEAGVFFFNGAVMLKAEARCDETSNIHLLKCIKNVKGWKHQRISLV